MVMAVGVAAIPVENLGSVQADSAGGNVYTKITSEYNRFNAGGANAIADKYTGAYAEYETKYNTADDSKLLIQRIEGTNIVNAFYAAPSTLNNTDAMVTEYLAGNSDDFVINEKEYYNYIIISKPAIIPPFCSSLQPLGEHSSQNPRIGPGNWELQAVWVRSQSEAGS